MMSYFAKPFLLLFLFGLFVTADATDSNRHPEPAASDNTDQSVKKDEEVVRYLKGKVKNGKINAPVVTPIPGMFQVKVGGQYIYMARNGRYGIIGELVDFKDGVYLTEVARAIERLKVLKDLPESEMVVYPAQGESRASLTIFTDTTCPFCRKLHKELPMLRKEGVTIRYMPFSRSGTEGESFKSLQSVWCAEDRKKAMDVAKGTSWGFLGDKECEDGKRILNAGLKLGQQLEVKGTPSILFQDGRKRDGYLSTEQLLKILELEKRSK